MVLYAGPRWHNGEPEEAWVRAENGRVEDEGKGRPPGTAEPAVLLDGLVDYHTHVGDAFLRGRHLPPDLAELVAPGTGYKHRMLAQARPAEVESAMRTHLETLWRLGTVEAFDFREQGVDGVSLGRRVAAGGSVPKLHWLGRPSYVPAPPSDEVQRLLAEADGVGAPSLTDWGRSTCADLSRAAHAAGKIFALHASEARREPIDDILALQPDLVVHLCAATPADLKRVADAGIRVVLCPTSNRRFGLRTPIHELVRLKASWLLGTDNAMLGGGDLIAEARELRLLDPDVTDEAVLAALTTPPEKSISRRVAQTGKKRPPGRLVVLPRDTHGRVRWDAPPLALER